MSCQQTPCSPYVRFGSIAISPAISGGTSQRKSLEPTQQQLGRFGLASISFTC